MPKAIFSPSSSVNVNASTAATLVNQSRAGALLGVAPGSTPQIATTEVRGPRDVKRFVVSLPDGGSGPVVASGDFYYVESILTGDLSVPLAVISPLTIKPDTGQVSSPVLAYNQKVKFVAPFNNLEVTNPAGNGVVKIVIWVGFGDYLSPLQRVAALTSSFYVASNAVVSALAYTVRDAVCTGPLVINGFFPPGVNGAKITRARVTTNPTAGTTTNANFRLWFYGDNGSAPAASVDHTAYNIDTAKIDYLAPPLDFPSFIVAAFVGGAGNRITCDVVGTDTVIYAGPSSGKLYLQLQALAAYVPDAGGTFRIDLTAEYF
jgi:hypothetical protein